LTSITSCVIIKLPKEKEKNKMVVVNVSKEDMKKLENAFAPSAWVQRGINRINSMTPYPSKEERKRIFAEEKAKG
jgi:hypothetical protein